MSAHTGARRRGSPLTMLIVLLAVWIGGRAALWESPFPLIELPAAERLFAERTLSPDTEDGADVALAMLEGSQTPLAKLAVAGISSPVLVTMSSRSVPGYPRRGESADVAAGHNFLLRAAYAMDWHSNGFGAMFGNPGLRAAEDSTAPFYSAQPRAEQVGVSDRWSLDSYLYYRPGSPSISTSQGRAPVYGASQVAANLQYRFAPRSRHDPRAYLRAYHALVRAGESELAAGLSARPLASLPLRFAGEMRATRNPQGTDYRPAAYAVTELPAQRLPLRFSLEAYGAAGYVGGDADTHFAEGQAAATREVVSFRGLNDQPMRLSLGGAAWGGAQKDASRVDVGPTLRLDLSVGEVPARISVDWRERVAGDAVPDSGIAATVSTRF